MDNNTFFHKPIITKSERRNANRHASFIIWLTGLSGSGKSTIAYSVEERLYRRGMKTYVLDGDNVRKGLNSNLGFSMEDREENIRRIGEVAKLFVDAGIVVITAFISPYEKDRALARSIVDPNEFCEVYIKCPLEVCEQRDVKGLYKKARQGALKNFTGLDDPYEEPRHPELIIETAKASVGESVNQLLAFLESHKFMPRQNVVA